MAHLGILLTKRGNY